ncbi:ABC transporter ATP-binding protein [Bacillus xiapuensis]|uniref:ABC transporter ATP-binding protein n=1 Tax=Bacillus xiapuensis TaxID=2014075 RepID=UPI000C238AAA|nr:ABC transporter ATP-binding protein [Bacillus xiapuensis]
MTEWLIETSDLTKKFGSFLAVNHVNLRVPKGGIYGFLGPNGAGKSTTIRMLLGLVQPTKGDLKLFGQSIRTDRMEILRRVGSLVESPSYYGHLTAYENLEITRKILGVSKEEIDRVLEIVRLTAVKKKKVKQFSLGMKQRLGIAQALLGKPELLILDEPTNGLDPAGILEIRDLIISLPKKYGITVLISSHILSEIERVATHIGIINKGKLLFQGTLDELRSKQTAAVMVQAAPKQEALKLLKENKYSWTDKGEFIQMDGVVKPAEINRQLVSSGLDVNAIFMEKKSLERIFLEMTEEAVE